MSKKLFTQKDISELKKQFTKDDLQLAQWLKSCPHELIEILLDILSRQFTNLVMTDCFLQDHQLNCLHPIVKTKIRPHLSILLVYELKRYAAHSLHFKARKPGYESILTQVIKNISLAKGQDFKNMPKSITEKEIFLTQLLAIKTSTQASTETFKILKKSFPLLLKATLKRVSPQVIKRFTPALGWALLAKDIYDFGGEAVRITVPFVINIAVYRTLENAKC